MKKSFAVLVAVVAAVVAAVVVGTPAGAHEEISPASVPTGKPAYLILSAANEKRVDLNRVAIAAPSGGEFGHATRDPAGWTANLTHTNATWTGGAIRPGRFEQFGFDIEGFSQPGTFTYRVTLGYADGSSDNVEVAVTAAAEAGSTGSSTPATTSAPPTTPGAPEQPSATATGDDSADGLATAALGIGIVALLLAVVAVFQARKAARRPSVERPTPAATSTGQDW